MKFCLMLVTASALMGQSISLDDTGKLKPVGVKVESVTFKGKKALKVTDASQSDLAERMVMLNTPFENGTIELEVSGEPAQSAGQGARGFVGLAFRVATDKNYECFYIRPTNGRADDQVRRNHSIQYISHPEFPWMKLRKEETEKYESYADMGPGEWVKMKIEVNGTKARLYLHGNAQPNLIVNDLKRGDSKGTLALWIGPGTVAHFSGLKVTR